jgi:hypothetical protein
MRVLFISGLVGGCVIEKSVYSGLVALVDVGDASSPRIALGFDSPHSWTYSQELCPFMQDCWNLQTGSLNGFSLGKLEYREVDVRPPNALFINVVGSVGLSPESPVMQDFDVWVGRVQDDRIGIKLSTSGKALSGQRFDSARTRWELEHTKVGFEGRFFVPDVSVRLDWKSEDIMIPMNWKDVFGKLMKKYRFDEDLIYVACDAKENLMKISQERNPVEVAIRVFKTKKSRGFCRTNIRFHSESFVVLGVSVFDHLDVSLSQQGVSFLKRPLSMLTLIPSIGVPCWKLTRSSGIPGRLAWRWTRMEKMRGCVTIVGVGNDVIEFLQSDSESQSNMFEDGEKWIGKPEIAIEEDWSVTVSERADETRYSLEVYFDEKTLLHTIRFTGDKQVPSEAYRINHSLMHAGPETCV